MTNTTAMMELAERLESLAEYGDGFGAEDRRDVRTAASHLRALSAPGWADISTAPPERDGSYIVANDLREVCPAQLRDGHWLVSNMPGFADWTWGHAITHYMPLHEPPK